MSPDSPAAPPPYRDDIRRRIAYLMLFRLVLISLVLGATIVLGWLTEIDLAAPSSLVLFGVVGATYVLTILYALLLNRVAEPTRFAYLQLGADLAVTSALVHLTGGAQSAFTFFFPLSIIGAATVRFRPGAIAIALSSVAMFVVVALLGWSGWLPTPPGQRIVPTEASPVEVAQAIGLNVAGMIAVGFLAVNLGQQIQRTSASLETERTAAADLIALNEDIVRSLSSGLLTVDGEGRVLSINEAGCDILGVRPAAVVGRAAAELVPQLAPILGPLGAHESVRRGEIALAGGAGERLTLGISVNPLVNHRGEVLGRIINFQDLTELRRMERNVKQAERLAAIGSLAAGIAHEIRNPLAAISGSIELLRGAPASDEEGRQLMGILTREVDRLNEMISDLLDYTNPKPRQLASFDLAALCHETLAVFVRDRSFGKVEVGATADSPADGIDVVADAAKLRQVLWNLLRNAAEAAAEGGGRVTLHLARRGGEAVVEVADDGPGIARERLDKMFDPFYTTKPRGSGLGLATCAAIVAEHGGHIEAHSELGRGARFVVRLPLA